jgi:cytochrome c oxidase assembly protein subunit 11
MTTFAYASVPLYNLFCKVTGFGGTTGVADQAPHQQGEREITVLFNADVAEGLNWEFKPLQRKVKVKTGQDTLVFFEAINVSSEPVIGVATFNVTPNKVGKYFDKIQCFCFENQLLAPGERMEMPISFYVDPEIENDRDVKEVRTITLSYTFFAAKDGIIEKQIQ